MDFLKSFFKPSWKKVGWLFVLFFVSQVYFHVIMPLVPFTSISAFVGFLLNPANAALESMGGVEKEIAIPFANTLNLIWLYLIATFFAKEVSKDTE